MINPQQFNLLIVDDEHDITQLLQDILEDEGYNVLIANSAKDADQIYQNESIDLVLLDIWMPDVDGISLLEKWSNHSLKTSVIMMSGHGTIETAVQATKLGAYDFIEKPISIAKLLISIENVLKKINLEKQNAELIKQLNPIIQVIGKSTKIKELKNKVELLKANNVPVLFTGSSGSGKSFYARYLHQISDRKEKPFISINASSLSRSNQAAEIFGNSHQEGLISTAKGGTLFVDEVTDLEFSTQSLFIQLMEEGQYKKEGCDILISPNVRFCFSSQYGLDYLAETDQLKKDFYYKIQLANIVIPNLSEYSDDIPELINHFVYYFVDNECLTYHHFSMQALNFLRQYHWPGNIRELKNFVQRSLLMIQDEEITIEKVKSLMDMKSRKESTLEAVIPIDMSIREARESFEKAYFIKQLNFCDGNIAKLADRAGMERTNLYRKLKSLGIDYK